MIKVLKNSAEVVLGEKDVVVRGTENKLIFETIDEKQTIAITFTTEENMRCVVDVINYLHFKNYFKHSVEIDEKTY